MSAGGEAVKNLAGVGAPMKGTHNPLLMRLADGDCRGLEAPCRAS
jgi:hypothetical protein